MLEIMQNSAKRRILTTQSKKHFKPKTTYRFSFKTEEYKQMSPGNAQNCDFNKNITRALQRNTVPANVKK